VGCARRFYLRQRRVLSGLEEWRYRYGDVVLQFRDPVLAGSIRGTVIVVSTIHSLPVITEDDYAFSAATNRTQKIPNGVCSLLGEYKNIL
jgi:hypothetical protein